MIHPNEMFGHFAPFAPACVTHLKIGNLHGLNSDKHAKHCPGISEAQRAVSHAEDHAFTHKTGDYLLRKGFKNFVVGNRAIMLVFSFQSAHASLRGVCSKKSAIGHGRLTLFF